MESWLQAARAAAAAAALEVIIIITTKSWDGVECVRVVPMGIAAKSTWIVTSACGSFALSLSLGQRVEVLQAWPRYWVLPGVLFIAVGLGQE
jgi:hypothetical protein